jgi:hypothetical protein
MFYLACTRFTNATYTENMEYRLRRNEAVIYGTSIRIREIYPIGCKIIIIEMNNDTNQVEGFGFICNHISTERHKIYENDEYNRYVYRGKYWLSRTQIEQYDPNILTTLENVLFKGRTHLKRRIGITIVTEKIFNRWSYDYVQCKQDIKKMFKYYFQPQQQSTIITKRKKIISVAIK